MNVLEVFFALFLVCLGVHGQTEYCCSPEMFESDFTVSGDLLGINLEVSNARLSLDQTSELVALSVFDESGFFTLFKGIIDFPQEKLYIVIPLLGDLCLASASTVPFGRSCVTDQQTLLKSTYIGYGDEQLAVQQWDRNKPNITYTQVRTDATDGICYLITETFQDEGFSMTMDFTNMIPEVLDPNVFIPPNNCIETFDLLNEDSHRIPPAMRVLLTRGLDFY